MKYLLFIAFFSLAACHVSAQGKTEIITKGIEARKYYEQDIENGDKERYIFKEEYFNHQGEIIEIKTYKNRGKEIDEWFKYKYDEDANLVEEIELDAKGEQKERMVSIYKNGLKVEKLYYDEKDRLRQKRTYEYEYRK
ncbi:MAG: hypothetical protein JXR50_07265 [Prolixibacteraceae bacterium]|nr:hypothetical protein [Prolixibacteraceae bacterium]MBN2649523.1 hypothetical protein [Prolixibacteraceae bacterium]